MNKWGCFIGDGAKKNVEKKEPLKENAFNPGGPVVSALSLKFREATDEELEKRFRCCHTNDSGKTHCGKPARHVSLKKGKVIAALCYFHRKMAQRTKYI